MEGRGITSRRVLIVGSGPSDGASQTWDDEWKRQGYQVFRLDIDPRNQPDIVANMTDMGEIGHFHAVVCCHALEHLYPHEVFPALKEMHRVLEPDGAVMVMVPDLEDVKPTDDPIDDVGVPLTGLHLYYGDAEQIPQYPYMAHHCGFVKQTLYKVMQRAGFDGVWVKRAAQHNLIGTGRA